MPNSQLPGDLTQKGSESNMRISKLWNHHTIVLETANDLDHNHVFTQHLKHYFHHTPHL